MSWVIMNKAKIVKDDVTGVIGIMTECGKGTSSVVPIGTPAFVATLAAGETTLVFESDTITADSALDAVYTSIFGVGVEQAELTEGMLTLTFPAQSVDMDVKVVIA